MPFLTAGHCHGTKFQPKDVNRSSGSKLQTLPRERKPLPRAPLSYFPWSGVWIPRSRASRAHVGKGGTPEKTDVPRAPPSRNASPLDTLDPRAGKPVSRIRAVMLGVVRTWKRRRLGRGSECKASREGPELNLGVHHVARPHPAPGAQRWHFNTFVEKLVDGLLWGIMGRKGSWNFWGTTSRRMDKAERTQGKTGQGERHSEVKPASCYWNPEAEVVTVAQGMLLPQDGRDRGPWSSTGAPAHFHVERSLFLSFLEPLPRRGCGQIEADLSPTRVRANEPTAKATCGEGREQHAGAAQTRFRFFTSNILAFFTEI